MIAYIAVAIVAVVCLIVVAVVLAKRKKPSESAPDDMPVEKEPMPSETVLEKEPDAVGFETAAPVEEPVRAEPEAVKEEPKACIKPCAAPIASETVQASKKEPEINKDFLSKLVASKDACEKASEIPLPKAASAEYVNAGIETVKEKVPAEEAVETQSAPEAGDVSVDAGDDEQDDTYTDYSPEALVRRAAWNKGLRCRRQYGDHAIQVAFVKPKVAVYVLDPSEEIADEDKIKEEGWTLLRFDMNKVTDGLTEGDAIAEAVKVNLHAQKASKKKSGKK